MYSEQIEELIDAILEDGTITDKERQVLHKRAISEGIDPDEIDVIIDARLAKRTKEIASKVPPIPTQEKESSKFGELRKCPACGAAVQAMSFKCDDCGYEFVGVKANSSRERLHKIINDIIERHAIEKANKNAFVRFFDEGSDKEDIQKAIINFPVPNTKEDLLEFLLFLEPLAKVKFLSSDYDPYLTKAYRAKYRECVNKAKVFFSDDPHFQKLFGDKSNKKGLFD